MGQGRHTRPRICGILLIVSTIQGITPDAHDLASPLAFSLVGPLMIGQNTLADEDRSPDDRSQAVQESLAWQTPHQELQSPTAWTTNRGRAPDHFPRVNGARLSIVGERPLVQRLSLRLCRLVC